MRRIVTAVTVIGILIATAPASHAATPAVSCDKMKTAAAAKLFADILVCNHKGFADMSFDLGVCRTKGYEKCVARFGVADTKFGAACIFHNNGPDSCIATLDAANTVFNGI
jgi:hypothetical protein